MYIVEDSCSYISFSCLEFLTLLKSHINKCLIYDVPNFKAFDHGSSEYKQCMTYTIIKKVGKKCRKIADARSPKLAYIVVFISESWEDQFFDKN